MPKIASRVVPARPKPTKPARAKPRKGAKVSAADVADTQRLMHELEVHQIELEMQKTELEMQNGELRTARFELETALARYTELFDFAPIGYATLDAKDAIHNINHAGARLLGIPRAQLVGARMRAMLARDDAKAFAALGARVRASTEPETCELCVYRARGVPPLVLHVTVTVQPRDQDGLLLAFEDITQRRAEQEQLAATERALRESGERKDQFLATLSHELRNPLTPIRTSLFVLARCETGSTSAEDARAIIERQVTHLTRLVDDLLDVTRISRGKVRLQRERVDLVELVRRTAEDHRPAFDAHRVSLVSAGPSAPVWIEADPARILQAVSNLLGNALKFTPAGGRVEIELRRRGPMAVLQVRDTGVGIDPALLPHVFEPFTQAPQSLDRSGGGLGLGLAMVKGFIELHGGTTRIASEGVGHGTEIAVALPLSPNGASSALHDIPSLGARRVLVIEDKVDAATALEAALTMLGLEVRVANNGASGLEIARTFHPDVVLCDIGLPGMSGHDIARSFRRDRELRCAYLVALSGYAQPEDVDNALAAGFARHLAKPASLEQLARVIAEAPQSAPA